MAQGPQEAFQRSVEEGERRLHRGWPDLLATGLVGGIDVGTGVLALLLVRNGTHNELLAALAFSIGFIALTLAQSELFTENFMMPIVAVAVGRARAPDVVRLWGGTLVTNLAGGWVFIALVMAAFPSLRDDAISVAGYIPRLGVGWVSFALAIVAGMLVTLMTWMEHSPVPGAQLVGAVVVGFLLAAGHFNHVIVGSLEMFAALHARPAFGYLDWVATMSWAGLGNLVGGIGLVTVLRLVQAGGETRKSLKQ